MGFVIFILQLTLKVVLNLRQDEEEFYKTILHPIDVILTRGVEGVDAIEVDNDDLEEAEATTSFVEKAGVFDKAPAAESTPSVEIAPSQALEPSISKATFDKLVADMAEVKDNQLEIKAKLDLVEENGSFSSNFEPK